MTLVSESPNGRCGTTPIVRSCGSYGGEPPATLGTKEATASTVASASRSLPADMHRKPARDRLVSPERSQAARRAATSAAASSAWYELRTSGPDATDSK